MYKSGLSIFGTEEEYSKGLECLTADRQLKKGEGLELSWMGNGKTIVREADTGRWYLVRGSYGDDQIETIMLGAICGDVAGSIYERHNIKYCRDPKKLISHFAHITDDTVMTVAVAEGIHKALAQLPKQWLEAPEAENVIYHCVQEAMQAYGRRYPNAGYGGSFRRWLASDDPQPYQSWGNGSAMRASCCGWAARSLAEAEKLGEISAKVTHDHPLGIAGAKVVAGGIFLLRSGHSKAEIRDYGKTYFDWDFTLDEIRDSYRFDVSCQGSVPQALEAFLEGSNFADVLSKAISIGGDSDTIAAIAGSLAEVIYPIPQEIRGQVIDHLDPQMRNTLIEAIDFLCRRNLT